MTETSTSQKISSSSSAIAYNIESEVLERYEAGAKQQQPSLCCPTDYAGD